MLHCTLRWKKVKSRHGAKRHPLRVGKITPRDKLNHSMTLQSFSNRLFSKKQHFPNERTRWVYLQMIKEFFSKINWRQFLNKSILTSLLEKPITFWKIFVWHWNFQRCPEIRQSLIVWNLKSITRIERATSEFEFYGHFFWTTRYFKLLPKKSKSSPILYRIHLG